MVRCLFICLWLAIIAPVAAHAEGAIPGGGRNVFVKYDAAKCLVILGPAQQNVFFPGNTPTNLPMDDALKVIPGPDTSNEGIWVGLVGCDDWSQKYDVGSLEYYNERMAVWWRPDTAGRLRSWVQPYACLDAPGGNPPTDSYWLYHCNAGSHVDANFFTYSAADKTLTSQYSAISENAPQCPDHVTLANFELENVFSITPAPEVSSSRSRLYVNAPDSSIGGSNAADAFKVSAVYTDCTSSVPGLPIESQNCSSMPLDRCAGETSDGCFQVNGKYPSSVKVLVPEPSAGSGAVTGLLSVFATTQNGA